MLARETRNGFRAPKKTLGDLDANTAAQMIAMTVDIALIVDSKGIVRDLAIGTESIFDEDCYQWVGQRWTDTVAEESRSQIQEFFQDVGAKPSVRRRTIIHRSKRGQGLPIRYAALGIGQTGSIVALGRDLSAIAALQRSAIDAQQSVEREGSRLRHAETRYRLLFQTAPQPIFVVDCTTLRVVEANPAASILCNRSTKRLTGRAFNDLFDAESAKAVQAHLSQVHATGRADEITVKLRERKQATAICATLFRHDASARYLVRLSTNSEVPQTGPKLSSVIEGLPYGLVVTDLSRRVLTANPAFLDLSEVMSEAQARGELLDRWVGRPGVDLDALVASVKESGTVLNFATIMRGEYGGFQEIEVSAAISGDTPFLSFIVRLLGQEVAVRARRVRNLPRSAEQLTELVGRVTLKEIVRETTDAIEKLCIETALDLTNDNRASAAGMLGLSRQSLYSKLRRFGLDLKRGTADVPSNGLSCQNQNIEEMP